MHTGSSTTTVSCAAVDLGASSCRVFVARSDGDRIALHETLRFETPLVRDASGYECWDLGVVESRVRDGLCAARRDAPLVSVGIDSWGVDFVLLDGDSRAAPSVSYRDPRTQGAMAEALARIPASEVYRRTGIQFQPFNTLYQLVATAAREPAWIARARRLLLLPDYFHFRLCGVAANEYTNATTTQLWNICADDWDDDLLALAGISRALLGRPVDPGTVLGEMALPSPDGGALQVIAPATHDTASSVAAIPLEDDDEVFISSGTWSLMGIESRTPYAGEQARRLNITNEGGVERRYRVLKNIPGMWIVERLRKELGEDHDRLVGAARGAAPWRSLIDPQDPRFFHPPSMADAIAAFCAVTDQPRPATVGALARTVFESLALSYRAVAGELASLRGRPVSCIRIVGGGARNRFLNQLAADACEVPVHAGPVETSALGNACVQLLGLGVVASLDAARALIRRSYRVEDYTPGPPVSDGALQRFAGLRAHRHPDPPIAMA